MAIRDINNNEINSVNGTITPGGDFEFIVKIDSNVNTTLFAENAAAAIEVFAKLLPGDGYTDIKATPLDISGTPGTRKTVYLKIAAESEAAAGQTVVGIVAQD